MISIVRDRDRKTSNQIPDFQVLRGYLELRGGRNHRLVHTQTYGADESCMGKRTWVGFGKKISEKKKIRENLGFENLDENLAHVSCEGIGVAAP